MQSANEPVQIRPDDVYQAADDLFTFTVDSASGGNYHQAPLVVDGQQAVVVDDQDIPGLSLSLVDAGGQPVSGAVVEGTRLFLLAELPAGQAPQNAPLTMTVQDNRGNSYSVTIPQGGLSSALVEVTSSVRADVTDSDVLFFTLTQSQGGNYEAQPSGTASQSVDVQDGPNATLDLSGLGHGLVLDESIPVAASGTVALNSGTDGIASVSFGTNYTQIQVAGIQGTLTWRPGAGGSLIGSQNGTDIVRLDLSGNAVNGLGPNSSGSFSVTATLLNPALHAQGSDLLSVSNVPLQALETDGDVISAGVNLTVADGFPSVSVNPYSTSVTEGDSLNGFWNNDPGPDGYLGGSVNNAVKVVVNGQEYSLGQSIPIQQGNIPLGALTVRADGSWSFQSLSGLDQSQGNPSFGFQLKITDADGDVRLTQGLPNIEVIDGSRGFFDLSGLGQGLALAEGSVFTAAGTASLSSGTDGIVSVGFGTDYSQIQVTGIQGALTWRPGAGGSLIGSQNGTDIVRLDLSGNAAAGLTPNSSGNLTVTATLLNPALHAQGSDSLSVSNVPLRAVETDGDVIAAGVNVSVADGAPSVSVNPYVTSVTEGDSLNGTWNSDPGPDGYLGGSVSGAVKVVVGGQEYSLGQAIPVMQGGIQLGVLTVAADGTWNFQAGNNLDQSQGNPAFGFQLKVTDADGDARITQGLPNIEISDGAAGYFNMGGLGQGGGLTLSEGAVFTASGSVTLNSGSDGIASVVFGSDYSGIQVAGIQGTLTWHPGANGTLIGSQNGVDIVRLALSGNAVNGFGPNLSQSLSITAELLNPALNAQGSDALSITGIPLRAVETDGDVISAGVNVTVEDAIPVISISAPQTSVVEGQSISGAWSPDPGADGYLGGNMNNAVKVVVGGQEYNLGQSIPVMQGATQLGALTVKADGTWTFQSAGNLDQSQGNPDFNFQLKISDGDGDVKYYTLGQNIEISDGPSGSFSVGAVNLQLAEGGQSVSSSTLSLSAGSDNISSVEFGADYTGIHVNGIDNAIQWRKEPSGELIGSQNGQDIIKLELSGPALNGFAAGGSADLTVKATLLNPAQHGQGSDLLTVSGVPLQATESDGDVLNASVNVSVTDSAPGISFNGAADQSVNEGRSLSGYWNHDAGADGYLGGSVSGAVKVLVGGQEYNLGQAINVMGPGNVLLGVLTVNAGGSWDFQSQILDQSRINTDISFQLRITDADGDVRQTAPQNIRINDSWTDYNGLDGSAAVSEQNLLGASSSQATISLLPGEVLSGAVDLNWNLAALPQLKGALPSGDGTAGVSYQDISWKEDGARVIGYINGQGGQQLPIITLDPQFDNNGHFTGNISVSLSGVLQNSGPGGLTDSGLSIDLAFKQVDGQGRELTASVHVQVEDSVPQGGPAQASAHVDFDYGGNYYAPAAISPASLADWGRMGSGSKGGASATPENAGTGWHGVENADKAFMFQKLPPATPGNSLTLQGWGTDTNNSSYPITMSAPPLPAGAKGDLLYFKDCAPVNETGEKSALTTAVGSSNLTNVLRAMGMSGNVAKVGDEDMNVIYKQFSSEGGSAQFGWSFKPGAVGPDVAFYMVRNSAGQVVAQGILSQGYGAANGIATINLPDGPGNYTLAIGMANVGNYDGDQQKNNPHMIITDVVYNSSVDFKGDLTPSGGNLSKVVIDGQEYVFNAQNTSHFINIPGQGRLWLSQDGSFLFYGEQGRNISDVLAEGDFYTGSGATHFSLDGSRSANQLGVAGGGSLSGNLLDATSWEAAEGLHLVSVRVGGQDYVFDASHQSHSINMPNGGTLVVNANGSYSYTLNGSVRDLSDQTIEFTLKDQDGDLAGDSLTFRHGDDVITGSAVRDVLHGGAGDDLVHGGAGNDLIYGNDGNDLLYGDAGDDMLFGGAGNDILFGGQGHDIMSGGAGSDVFAWNSGDMGGVDDILDFNLNNDKLFFEGLFNGQGGQGSINISDLLASQTMTLRMNSAASLELSYNGNGVSQTVNIQLAEANQSAFNGVNSSDQSAADTAKAALLQQILLSTM